ncbi:type II secretion system minor pseudopilin GspK [Cedecea colo]|uniref:Type II secretion system protein K n=1 Tax=Cedecea colo TaxID=2552946 RepID=A0ABX0VH37_9ENTR|nr:type II secretion system minor pseudopilin GspK [Cedecea colo]NIY46296.1 general secretion pathway protein GspK [Cedecea colo]
MMKQRGMALLVVLMLLAMMASLAAVVTERWFFSYQYSVQLHQRLQGKWYAAAAETFAMALLVLDARDDTQHTHLAQRWATSGQRFPLEETELQAQLIDAQACFNLNAVTGDEEAQRIFTRLLVLLGEETGQAQQIGAALADWLDEDNLPRDGGAEDAEYASFHSPWLTAGQRLQNVSELRQLRGINAALLQRLRPLVCALPEAGMKININTLAPAQWPLLAALAEGTNEAAIRQGLARRPSAGWETLESFLAEMPALGSQRRYLGLNSAFFSLRVVVRMADTNYRQYSLLQRSGGQTKVLRRYWEIEEG